MTAGAKLRVTDSLRAAYDAFNYDSKPIAQAHVSQMETMAVLYGLHPVSADRCRVLELGCANGGNLIPMAYQLRDSHFVGIDLAPTQVEDGRRTLHVLGLANVELHTKSIADIGD